MLIKCPECGKEISDKSERCIHCGYPLKSNHTCIINGKEYDLSFVFDENYSYLYKVRDFVQITHCDIHTARQYIDKFISNSHIPKTLYIESKTSTSSSNMPKCPHCNSTHIQKISTTERAASVIGFGILSKKIGKSFKCLDCKYTW